ncbi:MAG: RDD family protein [Candidatus Rokubacteria bacterium]|nr:RDD family protein [Candidatus Rokubacteria bacterium]
MTMLATAGCWRRLLAHCLDCLVGLAAWLLCSMWLVIGLWALENPPRDLVNLGLVLLAMQALAFALHIAYHVVLVGGCGQTLGKMALGIAVVRRDGGTVGYGRAVLRCLGGLLSVASFGLGYVGVLFTAERRGLADWLAGTRVILESAAPAAAAPGHAEMRPLGA